MANAPSPETVLWPDEDKGPWEVTVYWRAQHGAPTPVGLELRSWRGSWAGDRLPRGTEDVAFPSVSGKLLRDLPFGKILDRTLAMWTQHLHPEWDPSINPTELDIEAFSAAAPRWGDLIARSASERRATENGVPHGRDLGDLHYQRVAAIYATAVREGRAPTMAVAEALTISKSAAAKQVARARERGFLLSTTRGRVSRLTEDL